MTHIPNDSQPIPETLAERMARLGLNYSELGMSELGACITDAYGKLYTLGWAFSLVDLIERRAEILAQAGYEAHKPHQLRGLYSMPNGKEVKLRAYTGGVNTSMIDVWMGGQLIGHVREDGIFVHATTTDPEEFMAWIRATDVRPPNAYATKVFGFAVSSMEIGLMTRLVIERLKLNELRQIALGSSQPATIVHPSPNEFEQEGVAMA